MYSQLRTKYSLLMLSWSKSWFTYSILLQGSCFQVLCQMSLHDSVLRLLILKFCHFFLMGLILKLADSMGGRYDHIISQYRTFYFTITIYLIYHIYEIKVANYRPLGKAPNPQLLPGRRNVGCPLLHLDGLNAENTFHSSLYSV